MAKQKARYVIRNPHELNVEFYEGYEVDFLYNKAYALWLMVCNEDAFKKLVVDSAGHADGIDKAFLEAMRAEIHFTQFHQFEAFFALLVAVYQDLPHWVYLTHYKPGDISALTKAYLRRDIAELTNGQHDSLNDFLNHSIYLGSMPTSAEMRADWQTNLDNIVWYLDRIARKYVDGAEYNAYKHGLRVLAGPTFLTVRPEDNSQGGFTWASDDSVSFLEAKDIGEGDRIVRRTTRHFNPQESITHLDFMRHIIATLKEVRLARLRGEFGEEGKESQDIRVPLNVFFAADKDALRQVSVTMRWSITV